MVVGVPVELPKTAARALASEQEEPLSVTVTAEGQIMVQTTVVPGDELIAKLRAISAERTSDRVYLRADSAVPYGDVAIVMGALNRGGFTNIGLVTDNGGPSMDGSAAPSGN